MWSLYSVLNKNMNVRKWNHTGLSNQKKQYKKGEHHQKMKKPTTSVLWETLSLPLTTKSYVRAFRIPAPFVSVKVCFVDARQRRRKRKQRDFIFSMLQLHA